MVQWIDVATLNDAYLADDTGALLEFTCGIGAAFEIGSCARTGIFGGGVVNLGL